MLILMRFCDSGSGRDYGEEITHLTFELAGRWREHVGTTVGEMISLNVVAQRG